MCGIGGILRIWPASQRDLALRTPHAQSIPEMWLDILDDSIKHRGPDGQGRFRDRATRTDGYVVDVALVHRRLSIIDHAGGHQPMVSELPLPEGGGRAVGSLHADALADTAVAAIFHGKPSEPVSYRASTSPTGDRIAVAFNGCIYNHRELRAELQRAGHVFRTDHSDTEVLVHGWRQWKEMLHPRLDGMFAALVWDRAACELAVMRDLFGEKPLYRMYLGQHGSDEGFVNGFGSSAAGLARLSVAVGLPPTHGDNHFWNLAPWLARGFDPNLTPLPGVMSVPPGHCFAECRLSDRNEDWAPRGAPPTTEPARPLRNPYELRHELERAVQTRLEADVPIGCFLSGGVDSSLVAFFAKRALGSLDTFTVRMPGPRVDESEQAQAVADTLGTNHRVIEAHAEPGADLPALIHEMGLPFGDSSLLPTAWVSRAARQSVTVALGGDGGDDLFLGYERQRAWARVSWDPLLRGLVSRAPDWVIALARNAPARERVRRLRSACSRGRGYDELLNIFIRDDLNELMPAIMPTLERVLQSTPDWRRVDPRVYLPGDLNTKVDSAAMAVALEVRSPLQSRALAERATATSTRRLMWGGQRKGMLRAVARECLPQTIVDRPKMGFAIPIGEWFRSDYGGLRTMLLDHLNSVEPFGPPALGIDLNMKFIRQMLDEHLGTGPSGIVKRDHSQRLYMLLVLSIWAKWVGGLRVNGPRP